MFKLTVEETQNMRSQFVTTSRRPISAAHFAFTEQGVAMLSGLLNSDVAIAANIAIMRALVQVREYMIAAARGGFLQKRTSFFLKQKYLQGEGAILGLSACFIETKEYLCNHILLDNPPVGG